MAEVPEDVKESLSLVEDLKFFLATAPANWQENQVIRRYYLNNDEGFISCVFWNNLYFITGTDIVRCILYKFQHLGRTVTDRKKFEEGIFSDLRNLKAGTDSVLENPKLEFLEFLYKNSCLRTQKKQKVFFWFNVPHDKLMADALERDIKKERANQTATSVALREPALLFHYVEDKNKTLHDQLREHLAQPKFEIVKRESQSGLASPRGASPSLVQKRHSINGGAEEYLAREFVGLGKRTGNNTATVHEDDDFPLDYLDHSLGNGNADWAGRDYAGRDYITLDGQHHLGLYINALDLDFDSLDASVFQNSVNVASTDDYLIEQTVPARAGNMSASQLYHPRLAKYYDEQAFGHQPLAYGGGTQFPSSAVMALFVPHAYDTGFHAHEPASYFHAPFSHEYPYPQITPMVAPMLSMAHDPMAPAYAYPDDFDYLMRGGPPSQRQQEASAMMLKKRRQLASNSQAKITKPPHRGPTHKISDYESKFRVQIKREDELLAAIPTPELTIRVPAHTVDRPNENM